LRLKFEDDGPTEIGGLVVNPNYRKHKGRLGRQLSYARFLYIKMKRRWFKNHILSELMPPLTENGESILWEAVGRRFTNLSYQEADALSRKNKEFVTSLFPRGDIYTCLLTGDVRDAIGKVGPGAEPVKHMLEKIGFRWREHIDPFDGGPHYWAETDKITIIKDTKKFTVAREPLKRRSKDVGLVGWIKGENFQCMQTPYELTRHALAIPKHALEAMELTSGTPVYLMPIEEASGSAGGE
jgi:arginine N-succinyltransferase